MFETISANWKINLERWGNYLGNIIDKKLAFKHHFDLGNLIEKKNSFKHHIDHVSKKLYDENFYSSIITSMICQSK